jgi:hypothetical protein
MDSYRAAVFAGRRSGKAFAARQATETAARSGQHVHVAGPGGLWCVTWHPGLGFLWARLKGSRPLTWPGELPAVPLPVVPGA